MVLGVVLQVSLSLIIGMKDVVAGEFLAHFIDGAVTPSSLNTELDKCSRGARKA